MRLVAMFLRVLAGPYATMLLGDMGADVIKVEKPGCGDDTRSWGPPFVKSESCYFMAVNRNKRSIAVDIKQPKGKDIIREIAKKSDVLIENFVPGGLDKLQLGYEDLRKIAPSLIYCSITGYGSDGPLAKRAGYDVVAAAMGGLLSITGHEDGEPVRVGVAMTDIATGLYAHGAIMAAILQRQKTGKGQKIDCNLLSTQVAVLSHIGSNYLIAGKEANKWGTGHESIVPYQAFKTLDDGYLVVGGGNDQQFSSVCKILGMTNLSKDGRYTSNKDRVKNRRSLVATITKRILEKTMSEWLEAFEGSGVPYGPVNSMQETFSNPQVIHNGMIQEVDHPVAGKIRIPGPAVKFSSHSSNECIAPPLLGQHTEQVLKEVIDYEDATIAQLQKEQIINK
ncbi:succinyl-CoA:glutarate CoA-transferase-like isoform X2 [Antedon mediterranea]|uniref:succinyl-CoA:glutarate CoA-transferase-like isoform X2 n=1 Tax=Antedon mediterranea TaxID=105859 RepID=UPI003AF7A5C2